jgi:hypothetical protein
MAPLKIQFVMYPRLLGVKSNEPVWTKTRHENKICLVENIKLI